MVGAKTQGAVGLLNLNMIVCQDISQQIEGHSCMKTPEKKIQAAAACCGRWCLHLNAQLLSGQNRLYVHQHSVAKAEESMEDTILCFCNLVRAHVQKPHNRVGHSGFAHFVVFSGENDTEARSVCLGTRHIEQVPKSIDSTENREACILLVVTDSQYHGFGPGVGLSFF